MIESGKWPVRLLTAALLLALAAGSFLFLAEPLSAPERHRASLEALEEKKLTAAELTGAAALSSVAVASVPSDATTPIANEIAKLSSWLLVISGILMLEKFLLPLSFYASFRYLLPAACLLGAVWALSRWEALRRLAWRLAVFGIAICLVIPASLRISGLFEETFRLQPAAEEAGAALEESVSGETEAPQAWLGGLTEQLGGQLTESAQSLGERAERALGSLMDSVAVLVISDCVIPALTLVLFLWLARAVFTLPPWDRSRSRGPSWGPRRLPSD